MKTAKSTLDSFTVVDDFEVIIGNKKVRLPEGHSVDNFKYIHTGDELVTYLDAAWQKHGVSGYPLPFFLTGTPGTGKNAVVYALAKNFQQKLFVMQGNTGLQASDMTVNGVLGADGNVEYFASPLVAAVVLGGVFFFDEIAKVKSKELSPLASLLDNNQRSVYCELIGCTIKAHPNFRFCAAYNPSDMDGFSLPDWLLDRVGLTFHLTQPPYEAMVQIAVNQTPLVKPIADRVCQISAALNLPVSTRKFIAIVEYAFRLERVEQGKIGNTNQQLAAAFQYVMGSGIGEKVRSHLRIT